MLAVSLKIHFFNILAKHYIYYNATIGVSILKTNHHQLKVLLNRADGPLKNNEPFAII
jgi:hypothetical protein